MALLDAGKCLGHYPATLAMEKAIEKAKAAGEPETESEHRRRKDGIPLAPVLVTQCDEFARELGVAPLVR